MAIVISMSLIRMSNKQKNDIILKIKRREKKIVFLYKKLYLYAENQGSNKICNKQIIERS